MLGIEESQDRMAKANSMRWCGHVLRKDDNVIVKALKFEVSGSKGRGKPKQTWKRLVENDKKKNRLVKEDACDRTKWRAVVKTVTIRNPATSSTETIPDSTCNDDDALQMIREVLQKSLKHIVLQTRKYTILTCPRSSFRF